MASCWLNTCLHLILTALDYTELAIEFFSELGLELMKIKKSTLIDPTNVKDIIVFTEDTRIASEKSKVMSQVQDKEETRRKLCQIDKTYLNLRTGQHCIRDFFICLEENFSDWIDLHTFLSLKTIDSTCCTKCNKENVVELNSVYVEMDVPPDGSSLSQYVEKHFNESYFVDYKCERCNSKSGAEKQIYLKSVNQTEFIIILLRRSIKGENGPMIVQNKINSVEEVTLK